MFTFLNATQLYKVFSPPAPDIIRDVRTSDVFCLIIIEVDSIINSNKECVCQEP